MIPADEEPLRICQPPEPEQRLLGARVPTGESILALDLQVGALEGMPVFGNARATGVRGVR